MFISVVEAKYLNGYKVWLKFNNGIEGEVDLSDDLWGVVYEPLKDLKLFKDFKISKTFGTIVWDNEADLSPEYLYDKVLSEKKGLTEFFMNSPLKECNINFDRVKDFGREIDL